MIRLEYNKLKIWVHRKKIRLEYLKMLNNKLKNNKKKILINKYRIMINKMLSVLLINKNKIYLKIQIKVIKQLHGFINNLNNLNNNNL